LVLVYDYQLMMHHDASWVVQFEVVAYFFARLFQCLLKTAF